jgi:hypothetical protein
MEAILREVTAAVGVTAAFVCNGAGKVEARVVPGEVPPQVLEMVARTLVQTLGGIELARKRKVGDLDMGFAGGRLLVKNLAPGCLCILTVKRVNIQLVNMTANVAVKKLKELRREPAPGPAADGPTTSSAGQAPSPAVPAVSPAAARAEGRVLAQIEQELSRVLGSEAQLVLYYEIAAMGVSKAAFPRAYLGDLVERVSGEIDDPVLRAGFLEASKRIIGQS